LPVPFFFFNLPIRATFCFLSSQQLYQIPVPFPSSSGHWDQVSSIPFCATCQLSAGHPSVLYKIYGSAKRKRTDLAVRTRLTPCFIRLVRLPKPTMFWIVILSYTLIVGFSLPTSALPTYSHVGSPQAIPKFAKVPKQTYMGRIPPLLEKPGAPQESTPEMEDDADARGCFCAGGSVCCYLGDIMDCDFGICGLAV
jgi:hypothetical protein